MYGNHYVVSIGFKFDDVRSGVTHFMPEGTKVMYEYQTEELGNYIRLYREDTGLFYDISSDFPIKDFVTLVSTDDVDYSTGVANDKVLPEPLDYPKVESDAKKETLGKKLTEELETYCSFIIASYALTDVIEALTAAKVKDIIVTKIDNNLVVKYKPHWRG